MVLRRRKFVIVMEKPIIEKKSFSPPERFPAGR
jgi:hypothetical protein